jgi:hypothetical protein
VDGGVEPQFAMLLESFLVAMVPHPGGLDAKSISFKLVHLERHVTLPMNFNPFFLHKIKPNFKYFFLIPHKYNLIPFCLIVNNID